MTGIPATIAQLFSTQILFFNTGQVFFVIIGSYGIWKIKQRKTRNKGFDK